MPFGPPGGFFVPASDFGSTQAQALGMEAHMTRKKMTIPALQHKKARGEPIVMVTADNYPRQAASQSLSDQVRSQVAFDRMVEVEPADGSRRILRR